MYGASTFAENGSEYRKLLREKKKTDKNPDTKAPSGILLHRIEWKGEGSKMPMMAPKTAEEETACT